MKKRLDVHESCAKAITLVAFQNNYNQSKFGFTNSDRSDSTATKTVSKTKYIPDKKIDLCPFSDIKITPIIINGKIDELCMNLMSRQQLAYTKTGR